MKIVVVAVATVVIVVVLPIALWEELAAGWNCAGSALSLALAWAIQNRSHLLGAMALGIIILGIAWVLLLARRALFKRRPITYSVSSALLPDVPIDSDTEDELGYGPFADKLERFIYLGRESPSIVLALDDKWGVGKTSALRLIRNRLKKREPQPLVMHFNPWAIGSQASLIQYFLIQLAGEIETAFGPDLPAAVSALSRDLVAMARLIPRALGAHQSELWEKSLELMGRDREQLMEAAIGTQKANVEARLRDLGRPIVVFVDDIDRLRGGDVFSLLQVIRGACDFNGICYVLACDMNRVANTLFPDRPHDGLAFLEKIVQVSVALPPISVFNRKQHLEGKIREACKANGVGLSTAEESVMPSAIALLAGLIQTPRDVVRLINHILMNLGSQGIFFPDRLVFQALTMKAPTIVSYIRKYPQRFGTIGASETDELDPEWKDSLFSKSDVEARRKKMLADLLDSVDANVRPFVSPALQFLFPSSFGSEWESPVLRPEHHDRIEYNQPLRRLLEVISSASTHTAADARLFLTSPADRAAVLKTLVGDPKNGEFLGFLRSFLGTESLRDPEDAVRVLMEFSAGEWRTRQQTYSEEVAGLIKTLLSGPLPKERKQSLLRLVVESRSALSVSERVLVTLTSAAHVWASGRYLKGSAPVDVGALDSYGIHVTGLYELVDVWVSTVAEVADQHNLLISEDKFVSILFRWGQFAESYAGPKAYLTRLFNDEQNISRFVAYFDGFNGVNGTEEFLVDVPMFLSKIRRLQGEYPKAVEKFSDYLSRFLPSEGRQSED